MSSAAVAQGDQGPRLNKRKVLLLVFILVFPLSVGVVYYWIVGTPSYSLYLANRSLEDRDYETFQQFFDVDRFSTDAASMLVSSAYAQNAKGAGLERGVIALLEPSLLQKAKDTIKENIRSTVEQGLHLDVSARTVVAKGSIAEVTITGYSDPIFMRESGCKQQFRMARLPNRKWRIIESSTLRQRFVDLADERGQKPIQVAESLARTHSAECLATAVEYDELGKIGGLLSETSYSDALLVAAKAGRIHAVEALLKRGVKVDATSTSLLDGIDPGNTPLMAAIRGPRDVFKLLMDRGANPNAQDNDGKTIIEIAAFAKEWDKVKLLLDKGADPNAGAGTKYFTPLMVAVYENNAEIVKFLLDKGANPNAKQQDGTTALRLACLFHFIRAAEILLQKGANPNAKDEYGTVYHSATDDMRGLLRQYGGRE
jgi:ankyrin repeat protein